MKQFHPEILLQIPNHTLSLSISMEIISFYTFPCKFGCLLCWNFTVKQQKYKREVGDMVDYLKDYWEEVMALRYDIKTQLYNEESQGKKRLEVVDIWLSQVDRMEIEVDELLRDAFSQQETTNKCLGCKSRYKLGRKLHNKLREVAFLKRNGMFDVVAVVEVERPYTIRTASEVTDFVSSPKLLVATYLELKFNISKHIDVSFLQKATSLDRLSITECKELEKLIIVLEGKEVIPKSISQIDCCFHSLSRVEIFWCPKLKDLTCLTFAPSLISISIMYCGGMEAIIIGEWKWGGGDAGHGGGGTTQCCLFSKLESLILKGLRNLESIYSNTLPFPCLKQVEIHVCPKLKRLPFDSNTAKGFVIKGSEGWWNRLEWEDEATKECFSSSFHSLG